jgi:hypothetical protein
VQTPASLSPVDLFAGATEEHGSSMVAEAHVR